MIDVAILTGVNKMAKHNSNSNLTSTHIDTIIAVGKNLGAAMNPKSGDAPVDVLANVKAAASAGAQALSGVKAGANNKNVDKIQSELAAVDTLLSKSGLNITSIKSAAKITMQVGSDLKKLITDIHSGNTAASATDTEQTLADAKAAIADLEVAGNDFAAYYKSNIKPEVSTIKAQIKSLVHESGWGHEVGKVEKFFHLPQHHHNYDKPAAAPEATGSATAPAADPVVAPVATDPALVAPVTESTDVATAH
ncbi:MAG: hypothetical protein K0R73_452 [Candidatus Midichloriaceae bacterium]|jgi:hypothetical protein|nr:hypothetical protein [Candidatus Midichloriaceae bacterium]